MNFELIILLAAALVIISIIIAKTLENIGIPTLLLFIGVGILAGSEGPGGIHFENYSLSQGIGIISLVFILFAGGLETNWISSKKAFLPALSLATEGVLLTAVIIGFFVHIFLGGDFLWSFLIGAIISSTDASAVFSILKMKRISLKDDITPLLELESGSNDPMAVFLTLSIIELIQNPAVSYFGIASGFFIQMSIGAAAGYLLGKLMVYVNNSLKFNFEGIYPVFTLAFCIFIYGLTVFLHGSGFLAVYIAGITAGNSHFVYKRGMVRFFDGLAMLSQIVMFLTLGLLVFPSNLMHIYWAGLLISFVLIFVARPISVFISLIPFKYNVKDKLFVSWVGLRGAVPVILAIFPLLAGIPHAMQIFNIIFFIVIISVLIQGWSLGSVAKFLDLSHATLNKKHMSLEFIPVAESDTELLEIIIPFGSEVNGRQIVDLAFPAESRIVLINRNDKNIIPEGTTYLESGDVIMILVNRKNIPSVTKIFK